MRTVEYFESCRVEGKIQKVKVGEAKFHQFGSETLEYETGVATYSTAIIELEDGELKNLPVEFVKFIV